MKCDFCKRENVDFTLYETVCDHCAKAMEIMSRSIVYREVLKMLIADGWVHIEDKKDE